MKIIHISDLHLGKIVNGYSMLEEGDQPYWCEQFLKLCEEEKPDAVVIAGDVYDRAMPSAEAVSLLDSFLTRLSALHIQVMMIAGNHDSPERIDYAHSFLAERGIHTAGVLTKQMKHITLQDEYGDVTFWLLPYLFPLAVSHVLGEEKNFSDTEEAMRAYLAAQDIDCQSRNVLLAHQNVLDHGTEGERGGSETMTGGIGGIDSSVFAGFDYTALGHIHAAYPVGSNHIRYCGSPLCYHFDETKKADKGPLIVTIGPKGSEPDVRLRLIQPLHRMRIIEDTYENIVKAERGKGAENEYLSITVTDRHISDEMVRTLRDIFTEKHSHIMSLTSSYENLSSVKDVESNARNMALDDLFASFYAQRHDGTEPDETERDILHYASELIENGDSHDMDDHAEVDALLAYLKERRDA